MNRTTERFDRPTAAFDRKARYESSLNHLDLSEYPLNSQLNHLDLREYPLNSQSHSQCTEKDHQPSAMVPHGEHASMLIVAYSLTYNRKNIIAVASCCDSQG
ncbi:hypothetical protein DPMN_032662 [Dreissena polymorpha]|uniref:Uncharacterized protein n=1 Tax=Dreissena polymorpha TaxID=45954 RepID=A0A9D4M4J7_DREPO|nr:hypothetical protein DPMN_032662 [Dreissena polymorpha]